MLEGGKKRRHWGKSKETFLANSPGVHSMRKMAENQKNAGKRRYILTPTVDKKKAAGAAVAAAGTGVAAGYAIKRKRAKKELTRDSANPHRVGGYYG